MALGMISVTDVDLEAPADTVDSQDLVVTDFSVAQFFCVLNSAGQVKCVGRNEYGQLGIGNTTDTGTGTGAYYSWMDFGSKVVALASGAYDSSDTHTCALTESGEIYCWGVGTGGALGYARTAHVGDNELPTDLPPVSVWGPVQASPDTIQPSNLKGWFDAADPSTISTDICANATVSPSDESTVQCWKDKSGNNNHVAQTTTSKRPTYHKNAIYGQGGIWFDSVNDTFEGS